MEKKTMNIEEIKKTQDSLRNEGADFLLQECGLDITQDEPKKYPQLKRKLTDESGKRIVNSVAFEMICTQEAKALASGLDQSDSGFNLAVVAVKASKMFEFDGKTISAEEVFTTYDATFLLMLSTAMM